MVHSSQDVAPASGLTPTSGLILTHFGDRVDLSRTYEQGGVNSRYDKPEGLWLSDESDFGWSEWNRQEHYRDTDNQTRTEFELLPGHRVLHLGTSERILALSKAYGMKSPSAGGITYDYVRRIDWVGVAELYDGIIITPYDWDLRTDSRTDWFYGWDCASACIWNLQVLNEISVKVPR